MDQTSDDIIEREIMEMGCGFAVRSSFRSLLMDCKYKLKEIDLNYDMTWEEDKGLFSSIFYITVIARSKDRDYVANWLGSLAEHR